MNTFERFTLYYVKRLKRTLVFILFMSLVNFINMAFKASEPFQTFIEWFMWSAIVVAAILGLWNREQKV